MRTYTGTYDFKNPVGSTVIKNSPVDWILFLTRRIVGFGSSEKDVLREYALNRDDALRGLLQWHQADSITWIGHATFFIKVGQTCILTDPFFADTAGRLGFGPKRYIPLTINIEDLPQLDVIVCSHNHYDHLDIKSLKRIREKFGAKVQVFCPLGLATYFKQCGFTEVQEMQWYEEANHQALVFLCLPAIHNSGRSLFDKNKTLWCSFGIKSKAFDIYFSGDTAYHPQIFKEIKSNLGNCDLAIVGIGAYAPQKLLAQYHANPEQAIQIAQDVNAKNMIGMHWGTLNLSDEPLDEPIKRFKEAAQAQNIESSAIWLMKLGETRPLERLY
ncbi:MAG: MBL fold metallo-hydrolase [Amoebophilaceae bacterium]|jgi:L-ascorbate metabolism protein UlaG (beta-lactamase superfamily)|nr:MBL fold metallo-hydrolase [Amoebophilaceae bacterium]